MAFVTTSQIVYDGEKYAIVLLTGRSDGSGQEVLVRKIRASDFKPIPAAFKILDVFYDISNIGVVRLLWDDPVTPVEFLVLNNSGDPINFIKMGGLVNKNRAGTSGDILLSTTQFDASSSYTIKLTMTKKFKF